MKVFSTVFVTEYRDEVTYKSRTFFEWLMNKPLEIESVEKLFVGQKVSERKYDSVQDLLKDFIQAKTKGESSNLCGTERYDLFFWLTKGKGKVAVQVAADGEDERVKILKELEELFGSEQVIDGKIYKIVFNVTDSKKHSELVKAKKDQ